MADGDHAHAHEHAHEAAPAEAAPLETDVRSEEPVAAPAPAPVPIASFEPAPLAFAPAPVAFAPAPLPILRATPILRQAPVVVAPAPTYGPAPLPAYGPPQVVYADTPPAYDFGYGVQGDAINGNAQFGHNENRNGYTTNGEYRVALPDGRTQVVTYNVLDAQSGYVADVKYEGQPIPYVAPAPRPAYGPAPVVPVAVPAK